MRRGSAYKPLMDPLYWLQLAGVCLLGAMSPGPSLALIITSSISSGRAYGVFTGVGHAIGIGCWAFITAIGMAQFMVSNQGVMLLLQLSGASLLAYIGLRAVFQTGVFVNSSADIGSARFRTPIQGLGEGLLFAALNPKVSLFFLAIFSHLVRLESDWSEKGFIGLVAALIDGCWYVLVALIVTKRSLIGAVRHAEPIVRRVAGSLLLFVAFYLVSETVLA